MLDDSRRGDTTMSRRIRKNFVIDTSVLVYHEDAIHAFAGHNMYVPIEVLEELDNLKKRVDSVGNAARYVNRFLDNLRKDGSLKKGVGLENKQKIFVFSDSDMSVMPESIEDSADNRILSVAKILSKTKRNVILISRDIALRVKADALNIKAENYYKEKAIVKRKGAYTGVSVLDFDQSSIDSFYNDGYMDVKNSELMPNEFVVIKGGSQSALGVYKDNRIEKLLFAGSKNFSVEGITPRSKEQVFALEMLLDPKINMVTITGMAGSGKTILSCAAAISMLFAGKYDKIIITRPIKSTSGDIGFLPGSKEDKMKSWVQPFFDNFNIVFKNGKEYLATLIDSGKIEIEALSYIRGRSLPRTIFILDEAQNINYHEAKAVLTRMGENSKVILIGDLDQIDAPHLDSTTCGLAAIVELFKDFNLSGHITLLKGERSKLATHAAKIL